MTNNSARQDSVRSFSSWRYDVCLRVLRSVIQKETSHGKSDFQDQFADGPTGYRKDTESKQALIAAAELRRISISDYVTSVTVAQARREVSSAADRTILLSPDEQIAFWQALNSPVKLTPAQKRLGALMRGNQ
jgi:uncharacterized protein (DUF1778 family)